MQDRWDQAGAKLMAQSSGLRVTLSLRGKGRERPAPDPRLVLCHSPHTALYPQESSPGLVGPVPPHCQLPVVAP